jgi:hypothetical protein
MRVHLSRKDGVPRSPVLRGKVRVPADLAHCAVCSAANEFNVMHNGPLCEEGRPAFAPRSVEYKVAVDEFCVLTTEDCAAILATQRAAAYRSPGCSHEWDEGICLNCGAEYAARVHE